MEKIIKIEDKQRYLKRNYPFENIPKLEDKKFCLHCENIFTVRDFKVEMLKNYRGKMEEYICCPNFPDCNGTVIDWMPENFEYGMCNIEKL